MTNPEQKERQARVGNGKTESLELPQGRARELENMEPEIPQELESEALERVAAYLDGRLSLEQTAQLERELAQGGAVARLLSEELMVREFLGSMPPDAPPDGLVERIEAALPAGAPVPAGVAPRRPGRLNQVLEPVGLALGGVSWSVRGAALALGSASTGASGSRAALDGLATTRYALGPLGAELAARRQPPRWARRKRPLWRRALKWVRK